MPSLVMKIVENLSAVGASGEGIAAPSPRTPLPLSDFGPSILASSEKSLARPFPDYSITPYVNDFQTLNNPGS